MEEADHVKSSLRGQAEIWKFMFSFVDSMALKCAVELRIPDIINSHGGPITLSQISSGISGAPSPDTPCLARIMRLLVRRNIFASHRPSDGGEPLYGLTYSSRWLLRDTPELSLVPMLLLQTHQMMMEPWRCLGQCVKEGGSGFKRVHGVEVFECASVNGEFNEKLNSGMECAAKTVMAAVFEGYKDGFGGVRSLVDVGGGTGGTLAEIVRVHPHINAINFDLPHVVATAPVYSGVSHVGGDMFESVPKADAVFMKWVMHDWNDEDCVKILKNCRKAISEMGTGKLIIVDIVLESEGCDDDTFDDAILMFDLAMVVHTAGGKERTAEEWKILLKQGGFSLFKIIRIRALPSIIEAFPEI